MIGGFARIVQGTEEMTHGLDITPSLASRTCDRLDARPPTTSAQAGRRPELSLDPDNARRPARARARDANGQLKLVPEPAGTRGYDDIRRAANREPLGRGVRPSVASIGDLARMVSALGDEERIPQLMQLRRLVELERARKRVIER